MQILAWWLQAKLLLSFTYVSLLFYANLSSITSFFIPKFYTFFHPIFKFLQILVCFRKPGRISLLLKITKKMVEIWTHAFKFCYFSKSKFKDLSSNPSKNLCEMCVLTEIWTRVSQNVCSKAYFFEGPSSSPTEKHCLIDCLIFSLIF